MSGHPHADLMAKAAEIAKTDKDWYRNFQFKTDKCSGWSDFNCNFIFHECVKYRIKPSFIDINGHQVPEPVREPLQMGQKYWVADLTDWHDARMWSDSIKEEAYVERGIVHLTKEAAESHIAALLSFTQK